MECIYKGQWKNDEPNGRGLMIMENGDILECTFRNGLPKGYGRWISGDKLCAITGDFVGLLPENHQVRKIHIDFKDTSEFDGHVFYSDKSMVGRLSLPNKEVQTGQFFIFETGKHGLIRHKRPNQPTTYISYEYDKCNGQVSKEQFDNFMLQSRRFVEDKHYLRMQEEQQDFVKLVKSRDAQKMLDKIAFEKELLKNKYHYS